MLYHSNAKAAAELENSCPASPPCQCDVASRASCELAFRTAEQALGRVDVLVSNAGIAQQKLFTDITPEEWQHMLDVNLTGAFHLCQLALPGMIRRRRTHPDREQHVGPDRRQLRGALLCSKGRPDRPDQGFGQRRRPKRHHSELCCARVIDTDMMAAFTAEDKAALAEETPVGRLGSADEVAQLLVFLAGEGAGYITGQVFGVNGGLVI